MTKRQIDKKNFEKRQKDKKTKKRQNDKKTKKTKIQKDKMTKRPKYEKTTLIGRQIGENTTRKKRPKREFNIVTSGQFRTLAMFYFTAYECMILLLFFLYLYFHFNCQTYLPNSRQVC